MDVTLTAPAMVPDAQVAEEPMTCAYCPFDAYDAQREIRGMAPCMKLGELRSFRETACREAIIRRVVDEDLQLAGSAALRSALAAHGVVLQGLCF
jgi:hypothetical protein